MVSMENKDFTEIEFDTLENINGGGPGNLAYDSMHALGVSFRKYITKVQNTNYAIPERYNYL